MLEDNGMKVDILLDLDASASEVAAVKAIAREEGIHGSVQATWSSRGLESPWGICLLAPVGIFFSAFFSTVGKEAGKDAYQGIRRLTSSTVLPLRGEVRPCRYISM